MQRSTAQELMESLLNFTCRHIFQQISGLLNCANQARRRQNLFSMRKQAKRCVYPKAKQRPCSHPITPICAYLEQHGFPIRYSYVNEAWPGSYYQTVYANEMGSAEMPSAGRAFTSELITKLAAKGVQIAPLILHTGVASFEKDEAPYEEYYRVSAETARIVNEARQQERRIIATGTTSLRALETVTSAEGVSHEGEGWTRLIITPEHRIRSVNAMLTGLHEPRASHLAMLESLAGIDHLRLTYEAALSEGYLWHEFGDLHLIFASPQSD
jgi:S-adenosylmethionine:tRNA ribosyltransferase-isomerase